MKTPITSGRKHLGLFALLLAFVLMASNTNVALAAVTQLGSESSQYAVNNTLANFSAAAGTDRVLIVTVGDPAATSVGAVTFGGTAMTQIITTTDNTAVDAIYYLRLGTSASPTTGNVVVTSAGPKKFISAVVFSGADQTTPVVAGPLSGSQTANSSLAVPSAVGDLVYDVFDTYKTSAAASVTLGTGQTTVSEQSGTITAGGNSHYFTSKKAGAASVTMSYTSTSEAILHGTINIKQATVPAPTATSISPTSGSTAGGTTVTITGTGFTGATGVTIGGTAATGVTVDSATQITATTPAHAAGAVDVAVTTAGGTGTGLGLYTYAAPASPGVTQLGSEASQYTTSSTLLNFTVPAGNDRLLVVAVGDPGSKEFVTSVSFGAQALTEGNSISDGFGAADAIWYLRMGSSATPTTASITVNFVGTVERFIGAVAFSGVDQTTPVDSANLQSSANFLPPFDFSLTVPSATGDRVFGLFDAIVFEGNPAVTVGDGQTQVSSQGGGISGGTYFESFVRYVTSTKPGAASVTVTNSPAALDNFRHNIINIKAVQVGGNTAPTLPNAIAGITVNEDAANVVTNLTAVFTDAQTPAASLTYAVVGNGNSGLVTATITSLTNLTLAFTPNGNGTSQISVSATDAGMLSVTNTFVVTVTPVNDVPSFTLPAGTPVAAGVNWTARESTRNWRSIASSADGAKLAAVVTGAGQIYTSVDSGATWTPRESNRNWISIASSADGTKLAAVVLGGQIYTSVDSGATWTPQESTRQWFSVTSSADGAKLAAVVLGGQIYTSVDSGATWTPRENTRSWYSIASSADGTKLAAVAGGGQIYTSVDSGAMWTPRESNRGWISIASSADGTKLAAAANGGRIYTSVDSGETWTPRESNRFWLTIASSADGTKLAAVDNGEDPAGLYTSTDSGVTWTVQANAGLRLWTGIAWSVDGTKLAAAAFEGQIYTSVGTPGSFAITVPADRGLVTSNNVAQNISAGPPNESGQAVNFLLSNDHNEFFSVQPAIDAMGTLTFTPLITAVGTATVTVQAHDDGTTANGGVDTSAAQTLTITITPPENTAPTLPNAITSIEVFEDAANLVTNLTAVFTDTETPAASLTYAVVGNTTPGLVTATITSLTNLTLAFTPNGNGSSELKVSATDAGGLSVTNTFPVYVNAVNDAPGVTFAVGLVSVLEDSGAVSSNSFAAFTKGPANESGQVVTVLSVANNNNGLFSVQPSIDNNGRLTFTPAANSNGTATVTVIVQDDGGTGVEAGTRRPGRPGLSLLGLPPVAEVGVDKATNTFVIEVVAVNDAPTVTFAANSVVVLEDSGAVSSNSFAVFTTGPANESGQTVTVISVANNNNGLFLVQPSIDNNGRLTFTPATNANANANGTATVTVIVQDDGGTGVETSTARTGRPGLGLQTPPPASGVGVDKATNTFVINVQPVNDAPTVTFAVPTVAVLEDSGPVSSNSFAAFTKGPSDELEQSVSVISVVNDNNGLFLVQPSIENNGRLTFTPAANSNGTATVTVIVQDNGGTDNGGVDKATNTFVINVQAVNDQPGVTFAAGTVTVLEDCGPISSNSFAVFTKGPANESGQTLTVLSVVNSRNGLFSVQPSIDNNGRLTFTPAANANGLATVTVIVQDDGGTSVASSTIRTGRPGLGLQTPVPTGGVDKATNNFTIVVIAVNDAPVFRLGAAGINGVTLSTWGQNGFSQLGDGTTVNKSSPGQVGSTFEWQAVAAGGFHTVGIKAGGTLWAWGDNSVGQLGDGTMVSKPSPVQVGSGTDWKVVAAGYQHNLAIKSDGSLWSWGRGGDGRLGDGTTVTKSSPVRVGSDTDWKIVSAGTYHSMAIKTDGTLWAWGDGQFTQLGDGTTVDKVSPVLIGSGWQAVSAGDRHTLAIKTDGTLWAWGRNSVGQLGDGTTVNRASPVQIGSDTDWKAMAAEENHSLAIKTGGTLWSWGENGNGQLGDGTTASRRAPVQVGTDTGWKTLASGVASHSVAIKTGGTLWAWGGNLFGQLGDGTTVNQSVPVQIGSATDWKSVMAGYIHTAALQGPEPMPGFSGTITVLEDSGAYAENGFANGISVGPEDEGEQSASFALVNNNTGLFSVQPAIDVSGRLTFTPALNANGSATVTVVLQDNGGTANGGVDASTNTFIIVVTPVNDVPSFTLGGNIGVDQDSGAFARTAHVTAISRGPADESGQTVNFTVGNNFNLLFSLQPTVDGTGTGTPGRLRFTPAPGAYGRATVSVTAQDNGGTENGGEDTSERQQFTLTVYAKPTNSVPGAQTNRAGTALRFSATNGPSNAIRVGDPDSEFLTVFLTVSNGTLTVLAPEGVTVTGQMTTNLVLYGTIASLNAALETLTYLSRDTSFGPDLLTVVSMDEGGRTNAEPNGMEIKVELAALGGIPEVSLEALNTPTRSITNVVAITNGVGALNTNLVQGIRYNSSNNIVEVLPVGMQDGSTNRTTLRVMVQFDDGSTQVVEVPVIIYQPLLTTNTTYGSTFFVPVFNPQTSLFEQKVVVSNNTPFNFTALRITATNLPTTITLRNASVTNVNASGITNVYIEYNVPVPSGGGVTLTLEYFNTSRGAFPAGVPGLRLELLNESRTNTPPVGAVPQALAFYPGFTPDGRKKVYIEFPSLVGTVYYVQYRDSLGADWKTSPVIINGTGGILNWMDDGPPNTETPPPTGPGTMRLYQIIGR